MFSTYFTPFSYIPIFDFEQVNVSWVIFISVYTSIDVGSFIIIYHDSKINQYVGLSLNKEKYFVHPESRRKVATYITGDRDGIS